MKTYSTVPRAVTWLTVYRALQVVMSEHRQASYYGFQVPEAVSIDNGFGPKNFEKIEKSRITSITQNLNHQQALKTILVSTV